MKPLAFKTKAETLESLQGRTKKSKLLPQCVFSTSQWKQQRELLLSNLLSKKWAQAKLIVRSSAKLEDTHEASMAGHFTSIVNEKPSELAQDIEKVIRSYGRDNNPEDLVLVQPMLDQVTLSGVAFSCVPGTGDEYYTIEYDETGDTSAVTSGRAKETKHFKMYRQAKTIIDSKLRGIIEAIQELETLFESEHIDIEFAVNSQGLWVLQARPLVLEKKNTDTQKTKEVLNQIREKIEVNRRRHPYLLGSAPLYGVMPDWNPAEIIGLRPKPLALSLYRDLVTDVIWSYQRSNYGYRNLRSFPLMLSFGGIPYIDVRVSFNSFIPRDLDTPLAERLVNFYLNKLRQNPHLHDKVEFEIVYSSYTFDLDNRLKELGSQEFSPKEIDSIKSRLLNFTNQMLDPNTSIWKQDLAKIETLKERQRNIIDSELDRSQKIFWLLEDCKRYGTLPFAGLARAAFVAMGLLKSMVTANILSQQEYDEFLVSLETVSKKLASDQNTLSPSEFMGKYGHLRPGTYEIESQRYDEANQAYFSNDISAPPPMNSGEFRLSLNKLERVEEALKNHGLKSSALEFLSFLKQVIEGREYAKFVFSKSVSEALRLIQELGEKEGISRSECAFLGIDVIRKTMVEARDVRQLWLDEIKKGHRAHEITEHLHLPPLIDSPEDVWAFHIPESEPNFVSKTECVGEVEILKNGKGNVAGKIVFIESADPGYDWIFSHGIKGLVTQFGGVNSHMAIRAAELGIAAVIGCGSQKFESWSEAEILSIDARNCRVRVLKKRESSR